jgi:hypothetical protein
MGVEPDGGSMHECDTFVQDCPPGEKCTVWASDGGSSWNATKCVAVVDDPSGPSEPCHVELSAVSGLDDCERGAPCWDVDPKTGSTPEAPTGFEDVGVRSLWP